MLENTILKIGGLLQVGFGEAGAQIIGKNMASGDGELNIMMPVMGQTTLESIALLTGVVNAFVNFCVQEMEANPEACEAAVEQSLSMVTSLNPHIGYESASALAKEAFASGKTIRELCVEKGILPEATLKAALDPMTMTEPQP